MEYDTTKTFREIHGTVDSLKASISEIERLALDRTKRNYKPINLRFLTPLNPQPIGPENVIHIRLTPLSEHSTASKYVAVSYTWTQPENLSNTFKDTIPDYLIWTSEPIPRPPRCPPLVLHRALMFARETLNLPLIWIDQECIIQEDPTDVENHLQVMHEVYERSTSTAAVLSTMIDQIRLLDGLKPFAKQPSEEQNLLPSSVSAYRKTSFYTKLFTKERKHYRKDCVDALLYLSQDLWFTRTWTFQEKYCASRCFYLAPVDPNLLPRIEPGLLVSGSLCVSSHRLIEFYETANEYDKSDLELFQIARGFAPFSIIRIKDFFQASQSRKSTAGVKDNPKFTGTVFRCMEDCSNAVVSDRIAIFTNVCNFRWTLQSTLLQDSKFNYSTCILVLVLLNVRDRESEASRDSYLEKIMDHTIERIVATFGSNG